MFGKLSENLDREYTSILEKVTPLIYEFARRVQFFKSSVEKVRYKLNRNVRSKLKIEISKGLEESGIKFLSTAVKYIFCKKPAAYKKSRVIPMMARDLYQVLSSLKFASVVLSYFSLSHMSYISHISHYRISLILSYVLYLSLVIFHISHV